LRGVRRGYETQTKYHNGQTNRQFDFLETQIDF
jgi:hypothetical protein